MQNRDKKRELISFLGLIAVLSYIFKFHNTWGMAVSLNVFYLAAALVLLYRSGDFLIARRYSGKICGRQILYGVLFGGAYFVSYGVLLSFCYSASLDFSIWNQYEAGPFILYQSFQLLVAASEELVFRGYFLTRFGELNYGEWTRVFLVSLIFGVFHLLIHEDIIQFLYTFFFSIAASLCFLRIKNFSMLSLITGHWILNFLMDSVSLL